MLGPNEHVRLECLKLAAQRPGADVIAEARQYEAYVIGVDQERLRKALRDLAEALGVT